MGDTQNNYWSNVIHVTLIVSNALPFQTAALEGDTSGNSWPSVSSLFDRRFGHMHTFAIRQEAETNRDNDQTHTNERVVPIRK